MKKVILMYADSLMDQRVINNEPTISTIHALLEVKSHQVWSFYNEGIAELSQRIINIQPDIIGVAINYTPNVHKLVDFMYELKSYGLKFKAIAYGSFPSASSNILNKNNFGIFDCIIKGEPEEAFLNIVEGNMYDLETNPPFLINGTSPEDLDKLPFAKINNRDELNIRIARGCFHKCLFCYERILYKNYRYRTVNNTIEEIKRFIDSREQLNKLNEPWVFFSDLDFLAIMSKDKTWLKEFVGKVNQNKLKFKFTIQTRTNRINKDVIEMLSSVGLSGVALGIESGSSRVLRLFNKNEDTRINKEAIDLLKKIKVPFKVNFIMYEPTTTLDDIYNNISFLKSINFPEGTIPSHPPVSSFDKLILVMDTDAYFYYKSIPELKIWLDNYRMNYDFLCEDTKKYYDSVCLWRKITSEFLYDYYKILNLILYAKSDSIFNKASNIRLKVLLIGRNFRKFDLNLMECLLDIYNFDEVLLKGKEKVLQMHKSLKKLCEEFDNLNLNNTQFRGWHGDLGYLLKDKY